MGKLIIVTIRWKHDFGGGTEPFSGMAKDICFSDGGWVVTWDDDTTTEFTEYDLENLLVSA